MNRVCLPMSWIKNSRIGETLDLPLVSWLWYMEESRMQSMSDNISFQFLGIERNLHQATGRRNAGFGSKGLVPVFVSNSLYVLVHSSHLSEPYFLHQEKEDQNPRLPGAFWWDLLQVSTGVAVMYSLYESSRGDFWRLAWFLQCAWNGYPRKGGISWCDLFFFWKC